MSGPWKVTMKPTEDDKREALNVMAGEFVLQETVEPPAITDREVESRLALHHPTTREWDEFAELWVDLPYEQCEHCRERWGVGGCFTVRIIGSHLWHQRNRKRWERLEVRMRDALARLAITGSATREHWATFDLSLKFAGEVADRIFLGDHGVLLHGVQRLYREIERHLSPAGDPVRRGPGTRGTAT